MTAYQHVLKLWDVASGVVVTKMEISATSKLSRVRMSPDGGTITTGTEDGEVRLWHADRYQREVEANFVKGTSGNFMRASA